MIQTVSRPRLHVDEDPRNVAAYSYPEASHILQIPTSTLRAWTKGQAYSGGERWFHALIASPHEGLSYNNVVEAFVLRALRTVHNFRLHEVREALRIAEKRYGIDRLLIHEGFRYGGRELFLQQYGSLVSLTLGEQLAMEQILSGYLNRVEYDDEKLARLFYPLTRGERATDSPKLIAVNPRISFGRPVIASRGIRTAAIMSRINAGETREHVAEDYGLGLDEVDEAILFEAAA